MFSFSVYAKILLLKHLHKLFDKNCVESFDDAKVSKDMVWVYSRKDVVKSAIAMFTEKLVERFEQETDAEYSIRRSIDTHTRGAGVSEYTPASSSTIQALNSASREPETLRELKGISVGSYNEAEMRGYWRCFCKVAWWQQQQRLC